MTIALLRLYQKKNATKKTVKALNVGVSLLIIVRGENRQFLNGSFLPRQARFRAPKQGKIVTFLGSGGTNILIYNPVTVNFLLGEKVTFMPLFQWLISAWSGETAQKPLF